MKKTIAKIMAAAMVLSTIAAPNVLAASIFNSASDAAAFAKDARVYIDGQLAYKYGSWVQGNYGAYEDGAFDETEDAANAFALTEQQMTKLLYATQDSATNYDYDEAVLGGGVINAEAPVMEVATTGKTTGLTASDAVTPSAAASVKDYATTATTTELSDIYKTIGVWVSKDTVENGNFNDIVVNARSSRDCVNWRVAGGFAWPSFDFGVNGTAEIVRQLNAGNVILVPMTVQFWNGTRWQDTALTRWMWFWNVNTATADDDYWNAIVKLKADNNRYTPIRVHVDAVEGSIAGLQGLYVQVVNGTTVQFVTADRRLIGTNNIAITALADNRLQIQDVQPNDLALLKSDAAKGKNLMLDEAYLFRTADALNNSSYYGAGDLVYDFSILGQNTDLGTVSIGKISDIRSRIFKECKEKLVHAKNVKWIRNGAFRKNKQLKKAILSDDTSMKKINEKAFYDCKKLNTVKVKVNTLKQVGKNAFGGSTDKKGLKFNLKCGNKTQYNKAVKLFKKSGVKKAKFRKI